MAPDNTLYVSPQGLLRLHSLDTTAQRRLQQFLPCKITCLPGKTKVPLRNHFKYSHILIQCA